MGTISSAPLLREHFQKKRVLDWINDDKLRRTLLKKREVVQDEEFLYEGLVEKLKVTLQM
jgi:hypothetical protein